MEVIIPIIFEIKDFSDLIILPGLQAVDQAESDHILFRDPVDFIEIVNIISAEIWIGDICIIEVGRNDMSETVEIEISVFHILP